MEQEVGTKNNGGEDGVMVSVRYTSPDQATSIRVGIKRRVMQMEEILFGDTVRQSGD
jgi:hypothetical protein